MRHQVRVLVAGIVAGKGPASGPCTAQSASPRRRFLLFGSEMVRAELLALFLGLKSGQDCDVEEGVPFLGPLVGRN